MNKDIIQIIIVEDDKEIQEIYEDSIGEFNSSSTEYEIKSFMLINDADIPKIIFNNRIDAIIIDLDWGSGHQRNEGNDLVKKIYEDCRIPIFIISGNLQLLMVDYTEGPIFKRYQRDDKDFNEVLEEIKDLYSTGYTKVMGNSSEIDRMLGKVFREYMSDSLSFWKDQAQDIQTQRMLRFAITRINEMLTININDNLDDYDALEFYIKPSIKNVAFTGDIVSYDEKKYVVITAACDMAQNKLDFVVLCEIDFNIIKHLMLRIKVEGGDKKAENQFGDYVNNKKYRYHLLPPCQFFSSGGLVDFQSIRSVAKSDFADGVTIIASINPVFSKDIQARFSQYYGRQGQPQLKKDDLINWIKANR